MVAVIYAELLDARPMYRTSYRYVYVKLCATCITRETIWQYTHGQAYSIVKITKATLKKNLSNISFMYFIYFLMYPTYYILKMIAINVRDSMMKGFFNAVVI